MVPAAAVQYVAGAVAMLTLVGFGDSDDVYLFGYLTATDDDPITRLSYTICGVSAVVAAVASLWLLLALAVSTPPGRPAES